MQKHTQFNISEELSDQIGPTSSKTIVDDFYNKPLQTSLQY